MANRQVIMRLSALSLAGGAFLILVSGTGPFPSFPGLSGDAPPGMTAALHQGADRHIEDPVARAQAVSLPRDAAFLSAPELAPSAPADAVHATEDARRPAAFAPPPSLAQPDAPVSSAPRDGDRASSPFGLPCGLDVTATAFDHATIALGIAAPCLPDTDIIVEHAGLAVGGTTDALGLLTMDLPAFESPATVTVRLADGIAAEARVDLPDLAGYDRVALNWSGALDLELHAMEPGAGWRAAGHVHPGATRGPEALHAGQGHLTELGTLAGQIHVYTRPAAGRAPETDVTISVDAPVTANTCTRRAEASLLRVAAAGPVEVTPFSLRYPGCDAVGDTLVLQNALRELRLASR